MTNNLNPENDHGTPSRFRNRCPLCREHFPVGGLVLRLRHGEAAGKFAHIECANGGRPAYLPTAQSPATPPAFGSFASPPAAAQAPTIAYVPAPDPRIAGLESEIADLRKLVFAIFDALDPFAPPQPGGDDLDPARRLMRKMPGRWAPEEPIVDSDDDGDLGDSDGAFTGDSWSGL